MSSKHNPFSNMTLLDWLLAAAFTLVLALLANTLLPGYGWLIGVILAAILLYLAKRRRDTMQPPSSKED
jgi:uncharacterized membrane protein AbrB (regulator of aidB expression)